MIQYADWMCRGGPSRLLRHVRAAGSLAARVLAVLAALLLVAGGTGAMRADAAGGEAGFVVVICSDGAAKRVVLDADGNPVETSGEKEACPSHGPCCIIAEGCVLSPPAQAPAVWEPAVTAAVFHPQLTVHRSGPGLGPHARGPPSKDNA
jgi:hypothetical protein